MHEFHGTRYSVYETNDEGQILLSIFHPLPNQLVYFLASEVYILFGGGRGPGKTEAICWDALFKAYLVPGSVQIIFRRTMGELKKTIINRFKSMPSDLRGKYIGEQGNERVELPNGSKIYFSSARSEDDTRKMLSGEFLCVHFDEWSEWPYTQWKLISGSVRATVEREVPEVPHDVIVRLMYKQYWQPIWIAYDWGKTHHSYATWNTFVELDLY